MGKHFLVKTKDGKIKTKNAKSKGGKHYNAKELVYKVFVKDELEAFEKLPKKKKKTILRDIDNIIDNVRYGTRNGRRNVDLNVGFMKELAKITDGEDKVLRGLKSLLKNMKNAEDYEMRLFGFG